MDPNIRCNWDGFAWIWDTEKGWLVDCMESGGPPSPHEPPPQMPPFRVVASTGPSDDFIAKLATAVQAEANTKRENAGYSGSWNDGGAGALESVLNSWLVGLKREIPEMFREIAEEMVKQQDPEYQDWLRLNAKFGGKK